MFTAAAGDITTSDDHYQANWDTKAQDLDPETHYRITIRVGERELGFADVDVVQNGSELRRVDTGEYIGLKDGRTLPIKFRIETGIVGSLTLDPPSVELHPEGTSTLTALVSDLHGNPLPDVALSWVSTTAEVGVLAVLDPSTDASGFAGASFEAVTVGATHIVVSTQGISAESEVNVSSPPGWDAVALGAGFGCALSQNKAYCWGDGSQGQLGNGTFASSLSPGPADHSIDLLTISATRSHTCGLSNSGAAYCWGDNSYGQLGDGTTVDRSQAVHALPGNSFLQIAPGADHSCGLRNDGVVLCWGRNHYGQLGSGSTQNSVTAIAVSLPGPAVYLDSGHSSACATLASGDAYCWGYNPYGNLGIGSTTLAVPTPTVVVGNHDFYLVQASIWGGCGLTDVGSLYCWGLGRDGALGNGTNTHSQATPVQVNGGSAYTVVAAGGDANCAITSSGDPLCWGVGIGVGYGSTIHVNTPTQVAGGHTAVAIASAGATGCLVDLSGDLYCWGYNASGQVGDGTQTNRMTPVRLARPS